MPLIGVPTNLPMARAVSNCAAVPGETLKEVLSTGIVGMIIAHPPLRRVLV
jgi:hypothetical protein